MSRPSQPFEYKCAIVRGVSSSLPAEALRMHSDGPSIDLARARAQHDEYVRVLRSLVPSVIELPAEEGLPDACFVEDTCVVVGDVVLMTCPGHPSRRGEVATVKQAVEREVRGAVVVQMHGNDTSVHLDGGDVMWDGNNTVFVGLSSRTSEQGADALARAFPSKTVVKVPVLGGLHLKSCVSMCGPGWIAVGSSDAAKAVRKCIDEALGGRYKFIVLEKDAAANCVVVNGHILHRPKAEFPDVGQFEQVGLKCIEIEADELAKVDGALTCCSILFS